MTPAQLGPVATGSSWHLVFIRVSQDTVLASMAMHTEHLQGTAGEKREQPDFSSISHVLGVAMFTLVEACV